MNPDGDPDNAERIKQDVRAMRELSQMIVTEELVELDESSVGS